MNYKQTFSILALASIISTAGCSGTRMRNLISRSDYMTVEELEAQDALTAEREERARAKALAAVGGESETTNRSETLVSQQRSMNEEDAEQNGGYEDESKTARKSLLNIAGLFKKGEKEDSEIGPDPFVEVADTEEVRTAAMERTEQATADVVAATDDKMQSFEDTIAALEREAETALEETTPTIAAAAKATESTADLVKESETSKAGTEMVSDSAFSNFVAERREEARSVVVEDIGTVEAAIAATEETSDSVLSEFDKLLATNPTEPRESAFASTLFPELDAIDQTSERKASSDGSTAASVFEEITNDKSTSVAEGLVKVDDPFAEASEKHGFAKLNRRDPWAAFNSQDEPKSASADSRPVEIGSDQIAWGNVGDAQFPTVDSSAQFYGEQVPAEVEFDSGAATTAFEEIEPPSPFSQIPSPEFADASDAFEESNLSSGLVIPAGTSQQAVNTQTGASPLQLTASESEVSEDPFLDASNGDDIDDDSAKRGDDDDTATASSAPMGVRWSMRSWFLLIGCLLVIALLVLPDRQNRTNS